MIARILLLSLFLLLASSSLLHAGAWTQDKGRGFFKLSEQVIRARQFYQPSGDLLAIPTLTDYTTSLYGEYGVTDRWTLVGYVPFVKRITLNRQVERGNGFVRFPGDAQTGIADSDIGVRIHLLQWGATVMSTQIMLGLPLGDNRQNNGLYTGDGEFNQHVSIQLGHSFYPLPIYMTGEVGINHRTEGFSEEFRYAAEIGYTIKGRLTIAGQIRGVESFQNGNSNIIGGTGGLAGNNQRFLSYGTEINFNLSRALGLTAGVAGAARGQNVLAAPSYTAGVFFRL